MLGHTNVQMTRHYARVLDRTVIREMSASIEESATFTDADWAELGNDFMQRMGLANHQYIICLLYTARCV